MSPKVTVIIPTYNRASVLSRAISSVEKQTFTDWELIVVDDGSTDDTKSLIIKHLKNSKITSFFQNNRGVSAARNLGIKQSRGEWLAFLDSDDEWLPNKLQDQMDYLSKNSGFSMIHGEELWLRNGIRVNPMRKHKKSGGDLYFNSLKLCCISPSTVLIHKNIFNTFGNFREDFPVCEDYDLWLKLTAKLEVAYVETPLIIKYGGHEDQLSTKYRAMDYWRVLAMHDRLQSNQLNEQQKVETKKELLFKANLLLKGYLKHQNLDNYDRIYKIIKQ
jgi:glycosyltransferase involved in cell wall biosynthesis